MLLLQSQLRSMVPLPKASSNLFFFRLVMMKPFKTSGLWLKHEQHQLVQDIILVKQFNLVVKSLLRLYSKETQGWTSQTDVQKTIITDHIGVFHAKYRPKGGKIVYCFYATTQGGAPPVTQDAWYKHICCSSDLLRKLSMHTEK